MVRQAWLLAVMPKTSAATAVRLLPKRCGPFWTQPQQRQPIALRRCDAEPNLVYAKTADKSSTALHQAVLNKNTTLVRFLVERGALLNEVDNAHRTPLYHAADAGFVEIIEYLVGHGAYLDVTDRHNWTPLHTSAFLGQRASVEALLRLGADALVVSKWGLPRNVTCKARFCVKHAAEPIYKALKVSSSTGGAEIGAALHRRALKALLFTGGRVCVAHIGRETGGP